jgi:hypothetical protein
MADKKGIANRKKTTTLKKPKASAKRGRGTIPHYGSLEE